MLDTAADHDCNNQMTFSRQKLAWSGLILDCLEIRFRSLLHRLYTAYACSVSVIECLTWDQQVQTLPEVLHCCLPEKGALVWALTGNHCDKQVDHTQCVLHRLYTAYACSVSVIECLTWDQQVQTLPEVLHCFVYLRKGHWSEPWLVTTVISKWIIRSVCVLPSIFSYVTYVLICINR